jgi:hypothetical protein
LHALHYALDIVRLWNPAAGRDRCRISHWSRSFMYRL